MRKKILNNVLGSIGNTPIVKLNKITKGIKSEVYVKLEFMNPMGSVKDRIAKYMIEKAEKQGKIKPGDTIVENSSGNTALGLALVAIQKGYNLKIVIRDRTSKEKLNLLEALGAELIKVDSTLQPEDPNSYNKITPRIVEQTPNSYFPDQHDNKDNNETHYKTTGPEIWEQMGGNIDYFVCGVGTGGTICGVSRYLKEKDPNIKIIGIDPVGSIFYDYFHYKKKTKPSPYLIEGLGDEFLINCVEFDLIDDMYQVSDKKAFEYMRKLIKEEGILAGGSSGAAIWAVLKLAKSINKPAKIVTMFPDTALKYMSTILNDEWLREKKLL